MDHELVRRAQQGDREAFGALVHDAIARLYASARLIVRDVELAEDVVQDALIEAWRDIKGLRDPDRLDAWLHRLLVRAATGPRRRTGSATSRRSRSSSITTPLPRTASRPSGPATSSSERSPSSPSITGAGGGVFVARPDGTGMQQLAQDVLPGVHKRIGWSPDGQRIVFIDETTERMWIAHLDGSPTESVAACDTPGCDFPAWSPDGSRIAFSRNESRSGVTEGPGAVGIHVVDLATGTVSDVVTLERPHLAGRAPLVARRFPDRVLGRSDG